MNSSGRSRNVFFAIETGGGKEIFSSRSGFRMNFSVFGGTGLVLTGGYSNFLSLASILNK